MRNIIRGAAAQAALLLLSAGIASAASSLVDMRGRLVSVEAATAVTTDGSTVSVLKFRQTLKDGRVSDEIVPETADSQADLSPQLLLDPESDELILVWNRFDGHRMTLAASRRDTSGSWGPITYLETGKDEPAEPQAALDTSSRLHIVWKVSPAKSSPGLRHRAFDVATFQALGDVIDPFERATSRAERQRAGELAKKEPAKKEPVKPGAGAPAEAPGGPGFTVEDKNKPETFTLYGVESGCDTAVVFRVTPGALQVATLSEGKWHRGDVNLEAGADPSALRSLVSDIARRFCRP
jgi:hypothetical protein